MRNFVWFVFALVALTFSSCQEEEETVNQNTTNSFGKSNAISSLLLRVSQSETTCDNVLDNTSNFSIKLPVHVTVNSHYCYVSNSSYYETVQYYKDNYSGDDVVHFTFPITIVYPNHEEVEVTESQYNAIVAQLGDDSSYHEIDCINFVYPFTINKYNTNNQVAGYTNVDNDTELYNFIHDLGSNDIVGMVYPLYLKKTSNPNVTLTVSNNNQLEDTIDNAVSECNTGPTPLELEDVLFTGTWHVSYCYYTHDETYYYTDYNFTFNANETVTAVKNSTVVTGHWDIHDEVNPERLDLHNFDSSSLDDLENNWRAIEITNTYIRLKSDSSSSGQYYYLSFTKN